MCRLFGFRSVIQSQVHRSLVQADNALCSLSEQHPDGWGVAYYVDGTPHLMRSACSALSDRVFQRLSGVVASETVLAHVRKATKGAITVLNCHPFQHGRWVFAHNGDIPTFAQQREALLAQVSPRLSGYILGETDSEVIFFLVLTQLLRYGSLGSQFSLRDVASALSRALGIVRELCDTTASGEPSAAPSLLTCILTDGATMVAHQGGKELHYSTYKKRCADRQACKSLSAACEAPTVDGFVNHLIFSSQPLSGENVWQAMSEGDIVGVDSRMRLYDSAVDGRSIPPPPLAIAP
ncbi:MAG: Glutamine amidotransferase class-II [Myxococcaceae bacterium]|nr:Glutamine amidotransferase class-II [Myxococcaceae bacterium]